jgi:hypothetical protein
MKVWFVTPCYFDVDSFRELRKRCLLVAQKCLPELEPELILVDDTGGQDPQVEQLQSDSLITVITPPYNLGHQGAIVFALRSLAAQIAPEDYVVTLDCDGEDRPEDIPDLISRLNSRPHDLYAVSLAQRTKRSETLIFRFMYFFFKAFFASLSGETIKSGNFAAFRGLFVQSVIFHPYFDYCYSSSLVALPLRRSQVALPRGVRYFGKSKMNILSLIGHGFRMLLPFSERIATRGIIFFGSVTCLCLGLVATNLISSRGTVTSLVLLESMISLFGVLATAISFIFFATFHQTRAISLRNWSAQILPKKPGTFGEIEGSVPIYGSFYDLSCQPSKTNVMSGDRR